MCISVSAGVHLTTLRGACASQSCSRPSFLHTSIACAPGRLPPAPAPPAAEAWYGRVGVTCRAGDASSSDSGADSGGDRSGQPFLRGGRDSGGGRGGGAGGRGGWSAPRHGSGDSAGVRGSSAPDSDGPGLNDEASRNGRGRSYGSDSDRGRAARRGSAGGRGAEPRGGRGQGAAGRAPASASAPRFGPHHPYSAPDLPALSRLVRERAAGWSDGDLCAGFSAAGKLSSDDDELGTPPGADRPQLTATMAALAEAYLPRVAGLRQPMHCTIPLWACAKVGYWEGSLTAALMERLTRDGCSILQQANAQNHANLWWALSKAPAEQLELVAQARNSGLLEVSTASLLSLTAANEASSQHCANVLLACARLQYGHSPALLHQLTVCLGNAALRPKPQELANTLYALGELREDCSHTPRLQDLQRLADRIAPMLQQGSFTAQALSNMLLGCAKLGYSEPSLMQPLVAAARQSVRWMVEQGISNSLYALAVLCRNDAGCAPLVCDLQAELGRRNLRNFKPQELSNCLYALALLQPAHGLRTGAAVKALAAEVQRRDLGSFAPQALSNILYALALLQTIAGGHVMAVQALAAECASRHFQGFKSQDIGNTAWALAKLSYMDQGWYAAATSAAADSPAMASATPQEWSNLWYALALVRHRPVGMLHGMASQGALDSVFWNKPTAQACSNMLWALAVLGLYNERLVEVQLARLGQLLHASPGVVAEQDIANSLWALAAMPEDTLSRHHGLVEGLLAEAARRGPSAFKEEELAQLWQVQQELEGADSGRFTQVLPTGLLTAMRRSALSQRLENDPNTSRMQQQVTRALRHLKVQHTSDRPGPGSNHILTVLPEQPVEELCGRVDVLVELAGGRRVAVEVDGPSHFMANEPHMRARDGPTLLRDRQLCRVFGPDNVVTVPYWEWNEVQQAGEDQQQRYLRRLLGLLHTSSGSDERAPEAPLPSGAPRVPGAPQAPSRVLRPRLSKQHRKSGASLHHK